MLLRRFISLGGVLACGLAASGACQIMRGGIAPPAASSAVHGQLVIHTDFDLPANHRLIEEVTAQRDDVSETLELPTSDEPIHVYLFHSSEAFQTFIRRHYPEFPSRRAFFVETDTRLAVYAHWGDRVAEDLRHEVAHGYLHAVVPQIPLWLDEGIAEYFEVPRGQNGLNRQDLALLKAEIDARDWKPDLARLEKLATVAEMSQLDYAESWAWSYFLLQTEPARRKLLCDYLTTIRINGAAHPLSLELRKLHFQPEATLREFVASLAP